MRKRMIVSHDELKEILRLHREWIKSGGNEGVKADLSSANLISINLSNAVLSDADLNGANFQSAILTGACLSGADLNNAILSDADLSGADLSNSDLSGADLDNSDLSGANLNNINLRAARLNGAKLRGADLSQADLSEAGLSNADLSNAVLDGAKLSGVDLSRAVLDNLKLTGVDLSNVKFRLEQISNMRLFIPGGGPFLDFGEESPRIIRSIEFPPEYHQAGISILNYFGTVLRDKYPDKKAKVKIEQDGLKVTMIVESEEGDIETIEKLLDNYGLVIHGEMTPEKLLDNREKALLLKIELRHAYERVETYKEISNYLKADVQELRLLLSQSLQKPGVQITTGNITGKTVAIGQDATATTIIEKYENNKDEIDSTLEDFKKEVSDEMQQQVNALTAALKAKEGVKASGIWKNITNVFTASEKVSKFPQNAVDLFDKLKDFF